MKSKLTIWLIFLFAILVVVLGLFWSQTVSSESNIAHYFDDKGELYLFQRPDECLPEDMHVVINGRPLTEIVSLAMRSKNVRAIYFQQDKAQHCVFAMEKGREFGQKNLEEIAFLLGAHIQKTPLNFEDEKGRWLIRSVGDFIVFSNAKMIQLHDNNQAKFEQFFSRRDKNASFSYYAKGATQDFYCFPDGQRAYVNLNSEAIQVNSMGSNDLHYYNLLPKNISFFEYLDKDLLVEFYPEWDNSPLLEYTDHGVIFSSLNNTPFYVIPISDVFSANDLITSFDSKSGSVSNSRIVELLQVIPDEVRVFATSIENSLLLCQSQTVLEEIVLSYQMQLGFNATAIYESIAKKTAAKVHYRWYNSTQKFALKTVLKFPVSASFGYAYLRNRNRSALLAFYGSTKKSMREQNSKYNAELLWNFSLKSESSTFHQNNSPVIGVHNPEARTFSIVDAQKNILNSIDLAENLKKVHPLENGFLLESFEKLYWIAENSLEQQKEFYFKGEIKSDIAQFVWNGDSFLTFISDQKLHQLNLSTGRVETQKIPTQINHSQPQLHAFNFKGKLHIGYFDKTELHAVEVAKNKWIKNTMPGQVSYSQKIDGKVQCVLNKSGRGTHNELFGTEQQIFNNIAPNVMATFYQHDTWIWVLRSDKTFYVYQPQRKKGVLVELPAIEISDLVPVYDGATFKGMLVLDDVRSEIHFYEKQQGDIELVSKTNFRGAKFVKLIGNRQCVTFIEGQLVAYKF